MVLLPQSDVLSGDALSSASTEMASEGTPVKVSVPPPRLTTATGEPTNPQANVPPTALAISINTTTPNVTASRDDVTGAMFGSAGPLSPYRPSRVKLGSVYPCITCNLCKGYLIDATTIVECLHSFCHSCIMKHLRTEQYCPQCEMMINKAKPNIKPDATLQAIVYKLVPKLYENELHRRRLFYRKYPEMAAIATPEQRGEDTEYLIFSPNEKISLSLEYAEKELAEDNDELLKPKYLLCPAIFSIAHLKKFIIYKYGISERQFCVEIMYKVKTIILPDYYTLMDVAYIYTWKRDAPMKYYYRIRTTESNPVELPEVALRRSPNLVSILGKPRTSVDEEEDKENVHLERGVSESPNESDSNSSSASSHPRPEETPKAGQDVAKPSITELTSESPATPTQPRKNESIKLKIELNKNKYVSILQSPQPDEPVGNGHSPSSSAGEGASKSHKSEKTKRKRKDALATLQQMEENSRELKIKIEKMKDTGLVGGSSKREGKSSKSGKHLAVVPYKVELSPSISQAVMQESDRDAKRLHSSKNGSGSSSSSSPSYCKLKIKTPKSNGGGSSSSGSNSSSPEDSKHHHPIVLKIDQRSPEMATATLKFGMPRKTDKSMTPSPPPLPPSPPAPSPPMQKFTDEKSQFLNSFELAPIQAGQSPIKASSASTTPPSAVESVVPPPATKKSPTASVSTGASNAVSTASNSSPPSSNGATTTQVKRKAKDSAGGAPRSGPKKPKLSDDEMKAIVEKTVAENIRSPSEHIVPPMFLKPKVPSVPSTTRQPSPPLSTSSASKSKEASPQTAAPSPKRDSPRPFVFKTPPPPPPPIVSTNNIPAVKPSQQVLPAPIPQKPAPVPIRPAIAPKTSTTPPKALPQVPETPARKPTAPTKLPTSSAPSSNAAVPKSSPPLSNGSSVASSNSTTHNVASGANRPQKGLDLKRAQSNPSINIPPPVAAPIATPTVSRETEINKLRPEDLKKNAKVYGPQTPVEQPKTSEAGSFAVPNKMPPKTTTSGMSTAPSTKSSGAGSAQGSKSRPVNYLNYALLNSKAAAAGSRTPIPSYSSNSPSYSPDSPQYNPNLNFSSKQFKYANPLAYNSHLQNMLSDRKTGGSTSPPSVTIPVSSPSPPQDRSSTSSGASSANTSTNSNKRPASSLSPNAEDKKQQPPEKQPLLSVNANPLDKFPAGIPDGLSVTLATDEDDAARIKNVNKQLKNNFIEIRALPEVPITEVKLPLPLPSTIGGKSDRGTPPAKVGTAGSSPNLPGTGGTAAAAAPTAAVASSQSARKPSSPNVANPTYSVASSVPTKTTSTSSSSSSSSSSNGKTESIQRKFFGLLDKQTGSPDTGKAAAAPSQKPPAAPAMPPVSRPSTPKGSSFPVNNNKFKLPNATVHENGTLKLNTYRDVDVIPKSVGATSNGPPKSSGLGSSGPQTGPSSRMLPPPTSASKSIVPIAPKPSPQSYSNGRMAMSPPIQRSPTTGGAYTQPKSKTPPSHLPSMASMGPMFDIQMKSAAIGASGGTPSKKPPSTGATTLSSSTVPRRKIVPTSNSTSLVPLKTAPVSAAPNGSKHSSNFADFITLHPQGPVSSSAPPPRALDSLNQQQAALTHMLRENFARQYLNNAFPLLLQQFTQQQQNAQNMAFGIGSDSVTITASPMAPSRNTVSQNSLTVTAIPPGPANGSTGGRGPGNGVVGGHIRSIGGGGSNPGSRNSS